MEFSLETEAYSSSISIMCAAQYVVKLPNKECDLVWGLIWVFQDLKDQYNMDRLTAEGEEEFFSTLKFFQLL